MNWILSSSVDVVMGCGFLDSPHNYDRAISFLAQPTMTSSTYFTRTGYHFRRRQRCVIPAITSAPAGSSKMVCNLGPAHEG